MENKESKRSENVEIKAETPEQKAAREKAVNEKALAEFKAKAFATFKIKADNPIWAQNLFQITWQLFEKSKELEDIKKEWCPPPFDPTTTIAQRAKGQVDALFAKSAAGNDGGVGNRATQLANQQSEYDKRVEKIRIILKKRLPRFIAKIHYLKAAVAIDQKASGHVVDAELQLQEFKKNKRKAIENMNKEEAKMRDAAKAAAPAAPDLDNPDKFEVPAAAAKIMPQVAYVDPSGRPVKRRKTRVIEVSSDEDEQEATAENLDDTKEADDASHAKYLQNKKKKKTKTKLKALPAPGQGGQLPPGSAPPAPQSQAPDQQSRNPGQGPMQLEPIG